MNISGSINAFSIIGPQNRGNNLPVAGKALPETFDVATTSQTQSVDRESSTIEELELYFSEKIASLEERGHDTANVEALRDAIREAHENKGPDSPSLPKVIEYPQGGKGLINIHLSFGTEITGKLQDLSTVLPPNNPSYSDLLENFQHSWRERSFNLSSEQNNDGAKKPPADNSMISASSARTSFQLIHEYQTLANEELLSKKPNVDDHT